MNKLHELVLVEVFFPSHLPATFFQFPLERINGGEGPQAAFPVPRNVPEPFSQLDL